MEGWKIIGQLQAVVLHLTEVCKKSGVDAIGILEWMVGEGREIVENEFWNPLVLKFRETRRIEVVDATTIRVNLDSSPRLPFAGALVHNKPKGKGWVEVKRVGQDLFVDGKKVGHHFSDRQKGDGVIPGKELFQELEARKTCQLHPNVMDALVETAPHLIPEWMKQNADEEMLFNYCWDVVFRDAGGFLCVRYFYWDGGAWGRGCRWLASGWGRRRPAVELAS